MPIEPRLRSNLLTLFERYQSFVGGKFSTISAKVSGDARFYDKVANGLAIFSARRYDISVAGFSEIWPADLAWPPAVERFGLAMIEPRPVKA